VADDPWVATLLAVWRQGQERSMVGPGDPGVHLEHARKLAARLDEPGRALDLGSGAGIPGLALAGLWPTSTWVLVDAAARRTAVLSAAVEELGWGGRIEVVHGRAEELGREARLRQAFDLVTSRSFGPPAVTAECGGAFVREGGVLAVTEPPGAAGERWPVEGLAILGLTPVPPAPGLQPLLRTRPLDDRFPRRVGVPAKRPLF
jgi:16S rRNA (guanine527-N7)-methyltransferase